MGTFRSNLRQITHTKRLKGRGLDSVVAALFGTPPGRGLCFAPLKRCAGLLVVRATTPGWAGTRRTASFQIPPCSAHRLLSWGRSSQATGVRPFALPIVHGVVYGETLCPVSMP